MINRRTFAMSIVGVAASAVVAASPLPAIALGQRKEYSAHDRINARRLVDLCNEEVRKMYESTRPSFAFEPRDEVTREALRNVWTDFSSRYPSNVISAYTVVCDARNNPPSTSEEMLIVTMSYKIDAYGIVLVFDLPY